MHIPLWILLPIWVIWVFWSVIEISWICTILRHNSSPHKVYYRGRMKYTSRGATQTISWLLFSLFFMSYLIFG